MPFIPRTTLDAAARSRVAEAGTKEDRRKMEERELKPDPLPEYRGPAPTAKGVKEMECYCMFTNKRDWDLFLKHFNVRQAGAENSCYRMEPLHALLEALEDGRATVDAEGVLHVSA